MSSNISKIFDFFEISNRLKQTVRWKATPQMEPKESSADHSWHMALLAFIVATELNLEIDLSRALQIAVVHDLIEALTDDYDYTLIKLGKMTVEQKMAEEQAAIEKIRAALPKKIGTNIASLWAEYRDSKTEEGKFINATDKIEGIYHMIYRGHQCFHYPDIIGTFPNKKVSECPALKVVLKEYQRRAKPEFRKHGWQWLKEYEVDGVKELKIPVEVKKIFDFIHTSEKLKETRRWSSVVRMPDKESSADHSWHTALLVIIFADEFNLKVDLERSLKLALVHDLAEAIAGDVDCSLIATGVVTKEEKYEAELAAIKKIRKMLPEISGREIESLWHEFEKAETTEGKFVKATDRIESIDHILLCGHTTFDYPDLIAPYPNKAVRNFPPLIPALRELQKRLKPLYAKLNWDWKKEYDI